MGLVPLLLLLRRCGAREAFALSLVAGAVFFLIDGWWTLSLGIPPFALFLITLANSLYVAVFGVLARRALRLAPRAGFATVPAAWVGLEWVRTHLFFLAYPFSILGSSQYAVPAVAGIAAIAGIHGVSFAVVAVNTIAAECLEALRARRTAPAAALRRRAPALGAALGVLVLLAAWGARGNTDAAGRTLRVGVVQAGVYMRSRPEPGARDVFVAYARHSRDAAREGAELIVWPASSVPGRLPGNPLWTAAVAQASQQAGRPLFLGSTGQDKFEPRPSGTRANSAFLVSAEGRLAARYDKMRLLPFNEYLPLRGIFPWPAWIAPPIEDAEAGAERTVFEVGDARFGALICWENLFPGTFRASAGRDVDFMVSLTNEAFTPSENGRRQMLAINVFRAIENRVAIVRSATTGVSALIAPSGRILARVADDGGSPFDVEGHLVAPIPLSRERAPYTRSGDAPLLSLSALALAAALRPGARRGAPGAA